MKAQEKYRDRSIQLQDRQKGKVAEKQKGNYSHIARLVDKTTMSQEEPREGGLEQVE